MGSILEFKRRIVRTDLKGVPEERDLKLDMAQLELSSIEVNDKPAVALMMIEAGDTGLVYAFIESSDLADFIQDLNSALDHMRSKGC